MRSRLYLSVPKCDGKTEPEANARILSRKKANYAARNDEVRLLWNEGAFVVDSPSASIYRLHVDDVFMSLLDTMTLEGRRVSHSKMANNFAPRAFADHAARNGYREGDFERSMERLFAGKKIRVLESGPPSKRTSQIIRA